MGFEPLQTDEKRESTGKVRATDMDTMMLIGCSGFVLASIGGYALSVWPFFAFPDVDKVASLAICGGAGFLPAAILGGVMSRKFGIAGAFGAIGGSLAVGMFLYLRIHQAFLAYLARQAPEPEYPATIEAVYPIAWILGVALIALSALPKEQDEA